MEAPVLFAVTVWDQITGMAVITAGTDGIHHPGSLHYLGYAVDLRTRDLPPMTINASIEELKKRLGADFDVVIEGDHLHVEMQPKDQLK